MSLRDMKLEQRVKGILVRHYIDLRKCNFSSVGGIIYIGGKMVYDRTERPVPASEILLIEKEIRRILGVKDVVVNFQQPH